MSGQVNNSVSGSNILKGRSNNLVSAWASFCRDHSPALSAAVNGREGTADEIQELKNTINLFNTFAGDLTAKIRSLQINDHQRRVIESFSPVRDFTRLLNTYFYRNTIALSLDSGPAFPI